MSTLSDIDNWTQVDKALWILRGAIRERILEKEPRPTPREISACLYLYNMLDQEVRNELTLEFLKDDEGKMDAEIALLTASVVAYGFTEEGPYLAGSKS